MILYINACIRKNSRTNELAKELLSLLGEKYTERSLASEALMPLSEERLEYRTRLIAENNYNDPMFDLAKEFASADTIVISAPYWDFSFPTILKEYIENIYVTGIVSRYTQEGIPEGLCKAKRLYYVTTAGGEFEPKYSFDYIKELCQSCFGIKRVELIKAEMLDIVGNDAEKIIQEAKIKLHSMSFNE